MTFAPLAIALAVSVFAAPAVAAPVLVLPPATQIVLVQDKGAEQGQKKAKGKAKQDGQTKAERSNKGGEARGKQRADQVQGLQDTGKGSGKRP